MNENDIDGFTANLGTIIVLLVFCNFFMVYFSFNSFFSIPNMIFYVKTNKKFFLSKNIINQPNWN